MFVQLTFIPVSVSIGDIEAERSRGQRSRPVTRSTGFREPGRASLGVGKQEGTGMARFAGRGVERMPVLRRCGTCVHHVSGTNSCSGQCNHPSRRSDGAVALLVRSAELACRTSWGSDLWEPHAEDSAIDIKIWGPFDADAPMDDYPGDLIAFLMSM